MPVYSLLNLKAIKRLGYMPPNDKFNQLTSLDYNAIKLSA